MDDEQMWKRRFHAYAATRLFGLAMFLFGIAVVYTDMLREGGWPVLGAILAIMGAIDAMFAPRLLRKMWEREDRERGGPPA